MGFRFCICAVAAMFLLSLPGSSQDQPKPANPNYDDTYGSSGTNLSPLERKGRDTWYFWTGGGQRFWRKIATVTDGANDLLQYVDSRRNGTRFRDLGAITQPGCRKATAADEYGLWFDDCDSENLQDIPGQPTGVLGLRKFPNPDFDKAKWSLDKYLQNPAFANSRIPTSIKQSGPSTSICKIPRTSNRHSSSEWPAAIATMPSTRSIRRPTLSIRNGRTSPLRLEISTSKKGSSSA
jgi:hypothetical protein